MQLSTPPCRALPATAAACVPAGPAPSSAIALCGCSSRSCSSCSSSALCARGRRKRGGVRVGVSAVSTVDWLATRQTIVMRLCLGLCPFLVSRRCFVILWLFCVWALRRCFVGMKEKNQEMKGAPRRMLVRRHGLVAVLVPNPLRRLQRRGGRLLLHVPASTALHERGGGARQ